MWNAKEESGCLLIETSTRWLFLPVQIAGFVFLSVALLSLSFCRPFLGGFCAFLGGSLLFLSMKLRKSREVIFDPYLKKVFWKHDEWSKSIVGSCSFDDITHVLLEEEKQSRTGENLFLLVGAEKMSVLCDAPAPAGKKVKAEGELRALARRIRKMVGSY
ncbi:MAG TPA: hypothetical protein PLI59_10965 [Candidatus Obscuribacter sp.]|nr:hypothetical protein [Candidatus Obscuribacter sp.]HNG73387.1 hypothetical protein [Candidatus Obscuribacter sp.]